LVIFETPNPSNVIVGSCNFYFDPTHLNPLPSLTTEFLVQYAGFSSVTILPLHPSTASVLAEESEVAQRFNEYFYGPMDYAIVGYKLT
jgi:O-antigen chain-terminating methyltransferase